MPRAKGVSNSTIGEGRSRTAQNASYPSRGVRYFETLRLPRPIRNITWISSSINAKACTSSWRCYQKMRRHSDTKGRQRTKTRLHLRMRGHHPLATASQRPRLTIYCDSIIPVGSPIFVTPYQQNLKAQADSETGKLPPQNGLPLSLSVTGNDDDIVAPFSPLQTPLSQESILQGIVVTMRMAHAKVVGIRAGDPLDTVFLARY